MKILHINTWDKGGAAAAALRLHRAMRKSGIDSNFLVLRKSKKSDDVQDYESFLSSTFGSWWFKLLFFANKIYNQAPKFKPSVFFNKPRSLYRIHQHPLVQDADVICLHWTVKFIDYPSFFKAMENKLFIWTMHDMNPFSGGLHYLTNFPDNYQSLESKYKQEKLLAIQKLSLSIVGPSVWLMNLSKNSPVFGSFKHYNIPYCIDQTLWDTDKKTSRKKSILFVADNVLDERKGFDFLLKAIQYIPENVSLEILGNMKTELKHVPNRQIKLHGFVSDPKSLAKIYSEAQIYIIPSLEDNLPNTVIESHICGTPVVGFNRTGVANMIDHTKNGILVDEVSGEALAKGILEAIKLSEEGHFDYDQIAEQAKSYYNEEKVVSAYLRAINELTS